MCVGLISLNRLPNLKKVDAHSVQLSVVYDNCSPVYYNSPTNIGDGVDEKWYELISNNITNHFPHNPNGNVTTIKYYFSETSADGTVSWNDIVDSEQRLHVINGFETSILKWNNTYFYKKTSGNVIEKKKLVNLISGSSGDCDLIIRPSNDSTYYGICGSSSNSLIDTLNGVYHYHSSNWYINFSLYFHQTLSESSEYVLNRTGAHELGHVLGLKDIDSCENGDDYGEYHHEELLMGYSHGATTTRQSEITYKDLVGAAITRGYHTDSDHEWMYDADSSSSGNYKLICSICNGVKYISSLSGYSYVNYKACLDNHSLSSGNMMAVASYGSKDYYKCKYCRYVAPFTELIEQNYSKTYQDETYHLVQSQNGLSYSFCEEHNIVYGECAACGHVFHNYTDHYSTYNQQKHLAYCSCGMSILMPHAIDMMNTYTIFGHTYGNCIECGATIDLNTGGGGIVPGPHSSGTLVSENGSYILPNGIIMLVHEDLDSYLNRTLTFHPYGEVSE